MTPVLDSWMKPHEKSFKKKWLAVIIPQSNKTMNNEQRQFYWLNMSIRLYNYYFMVEYMEVSNGLSVDRKAY